MQPSTSLALDQHRQTIRARYAGIATAGAVPTADCGCGESTASVTRTACCGDPASSADAYNRQLGCGPAELAAVPAGANLNLGCGNPFAFADLQPGETVLDLGSGAGFDAFIAARALAGTGRVIGVDMTPEMVSRARRQAAAGDYPNVEFRLGEIEALPVADASVDLIISNCVINLSPDKPAVYREAFRVLRPGGRLSLSDVVARAPLPAALRADAAQQSRCIAGAETLADTRTWLTAAGFTAIRITTKDQSRRVLDSWGADFDGKSLGDWLVSAIIEARKPLP